LDRGDIKLTQIIFKMKKVLLTGASGTVGKRVLKELLIRNSKYDITLFLRGSRKNKRTFTPLSSKVCIIWGDIHNSEDVKKAVTGKDIIIHLAAVLPDIAIDDPVLAHLTNVIGTKNILNAMKTDNNPPKLIYTSSVAVYGERINNPIIKLSDPIGSGPLDNYAKTKIEAEKLIRESGLEYIIFRLNYVAATDILKFRRIMFHMPLETKLQFIHAKDAGLALVNAIDSDVLSNDGNCIYNLAGGKECRIEWKEHLDDLLEIMGLGRGFFPDTAFAKHGYNCGYFDLDDIDYLEDILHFQRNGLREFYTEVREWIGFKRYLAMLARPIIRWHLLKRSDLYKHNG